MTIRSLCIVVLTLAAATHAVEAQAQFFKDIFHSIALDTRRNNCWPNPFVCPDRQAVRTPIALMVAKGWERQNMLGDHHFEPSGGQLTEAGRLKVRWIVEEVPRHHRAVFVRRAETPEETAARIDVVQEESIRLARGGDLPPVLETTLGPGGWPASRVDAIGRKFESSTPDPRLPESDTGSGPE